MILVAGPPCGGKTTYVRNRALPEDKTLDYDDIVESLGKPRYEAGPEIAKQARRIWVASLPMADWVIWTAPRRRDRGRFRAQFGAEVVVVMASLTECLERAETRPPAWADHIHRWFAMWEPSRSGQETIIRTDRVAA
jgi:predicted kinase